jgi:hypothetical protein
VSSRHIRLCGLRPRSLRGRSTPGLARQRRVGVKIRTSHRKQNSELVIGTGTELAIGSVERP